MENNRESAKQFFKEYLVKQGNDNVSAKDIEEIIQAKYADMFWEVMTNYARKINTQDTLEGLLGVEAE